MGGSNCFLPGCPVSRTVNYRDVSLFRIPMRSGEFYQRWRDNMIAVLKKYREFDKTIKERLQKGEIYVCERHFAPEDIELTSE